MKFNPENKPLRVLLADDDKDDRFFFEKALKELPLTTQLTAVHDGEQLMDYLLKNISTPPNVLFLDLSMPRKNGFECLTEIKENKSLVDFPIIMFSTSYTRDINYEKDMITMLLKIGAHAYIRKPDNFELLKKVILTSLTTIIENGSMPNAA